MLEVGLVSNWRLLYVFFLFVWAAVTIDSDLAARELVS